MCYIAANGSLNTAGNTMKTATTDKKNIRNSIARIRITRIRAWIAAIDGLAFSRSKQITPVPRNAVVYDEPEYVAYRSFPLLLLPERNRRTFFTLFPISASQSKITPQYSNGLISRILNRKIRLR